MPEPEPVPEPEPEPEPVPDVINETKVITTHTLANVELNKITNVEKSNIISNITDIYVAELNVPRDTVKVTLSQGSIIVTVEVVYEGLEEDNTENIQANKDIALPVQPQVASIISDSYEISTGNAITLTVSSSVVTSQEVVLDSSTVVYHNTNVSFTLEFSQPLEKLRSSNFDVTASNHIKPQNLIRIMWICYFIHSNVSSNDWDTIKSSLLEDIKNNYDNTFLTPTSTTHSTYGFTWPDLSKYSPLIIDVLSYDKKEYTITTRFHNTSSLTLYEFTDSFINSSLVNIFEQVSDAQQSVTVDDYVKEITESVHNENNVYVERSELLTTLQTINRIVDENTRNINYQKNK